MVEIETIASEVGARKKGIFFKCVLLSNSSNSNRKTVLGLQLLRQ